MDLVPSDLRLVMVTVIVTIIIWIVLSFLNNLINGWRKNEKAFLQPQKIELFTQKTPAEIAYDADMARHNRQLVWLVVLAILWIGIEFRSPELATQIRQFVLALIELILRWLFDVIVYLLASLEE